MIVFNDKMDGEFKQLGFKNGREMFENAERFLDLKFIHESVPVQNSWILGYDRVQFTFTVTYPSQKWPHYIHMIRATTGRKKGFRDEEDQTNIMTSYLCPPLLTKDQMINQIYSIEREKLLKYKQPYQELMLGKIHRICHTKRRKGLK